MIKVEFDSGVVATLDDAGVWAVQGDPWYARLLNLTFSTELYPPSPADGIFHGARQAQVAASKLGGTVVWPPIPAAPLDDGRVY